MTPDEMRLYLMDKGATKPAIPMNAEPLGEDSVKWTSPLADTVNSHKLGSMSGEQWMSWLHANAPRNAKKEAHASGTFDWLPQQANASKEAIVKHMKANAPRIKVKKFKNNPKPGARARFDELVNDGWARGLTSEEREEMDELEQHLEGNTKTRFDEHVMPDGTQSNYREMTLSHSNPTGDDYIVPAGHGYQDNDADINRILHMRMNDRNISHPAFTGNRHPSTKALNIEELQSDWAQQGRSRGFKGDKPSNPDKGLPKGPYVQNTEDWTRLGLNNAIKEAAEKGHHAVTWTNGDEQAKRWDNEGLKHYYDTVMPSVTNDILKRMGVKERVGKFNLGTGSDHHGFHMTPEIVAHIKKHGLPRFASGGDIKKMRDYIANAHGKYEGHRFERASDEVPHLLESYDPKAVKKLFGSGDVARALMTMNPADFEKYSKQLHDDKSAQAIASFNRGENEHQRFKGTRAEYLAHLHNIKKFSSVPLLGVNKGEQGSTESTPWISGHEGRHRNRVLANRGHKTSLVEFVPRATLKEPFDPVYRDEYIDAIKKEMALMNNRVRPEEMTDESGNNVRRKIIQLPELFKSGGMAHMATGGDISKLKAYMLRKQGTHGAQRVERAADEVPNLENMYDLKALRSAFGDDKKSAVAVINPADFEKYSSPLSSSGAPQSEIDATVRYLRSVGKFSDVPHLNIHKNDIGEPIIPGHEEILKSRRTPRIDYHNGRHRSRAMTANGEKSSLVRISPTSSMALYLKSKTHPEYLDELHKEMAKTDHMVRPETYEIDGADQHRPAIALPKMFATGGRSVEALDRESDEVPIEKRVRDALDKIHLNASGGKDAYGTGAGGRLAVDFPLSKSLTLSPYLEGSAYKPNNQNTSSQISGAGLSLTKRFAEGGKAKFLEPSAEKDRWYHGTNRNIRSFKSINRHGHLGKPDRPNIHFVSKSPDVANQFAMRGHQHPQFGEPIELNDKDYMEGMDHRSGANVMPVHVQVKNPFDIENPKHLEAIEKHLGEMSHGLRSAHEDAKNQRENYDELEHPHIQRAIKDMGHDSFYTYELGHKNLGIYDPRKIKSAIGNRGTYDTNEHDITKSKGGLAHARGK